MPRGRPRRDQEQERETAPVTGQEPAQYDPSPRAQDHEPLDMNVEQYIEYFQLDIHPQEMVDDFIAKLTEGQTPQPGVEVIPPQDRVTMPEGTPEPVRDFIEYFELHRFFQRDELVDHINAMTSELQMEQAGMGAPSVPTEHEQVPAPDEQQNPIPLNVRITSLEMDGSTRAFASADYGDLTINRLRVKQDEYGTLSVSMPRFRQAEGWKDTCAFNTVESRNRLTGEVLDAYDRQLAQIHGQGQGQEQTESDDQEQAQGAEMDDAPDMDGQEQDGSGMSMGMSMSQ